MTSSEIVVQKALEHGQWFTAKEVWKRTKLVDGEGVALSTTTAMLKWLIDAGLALRKSSNGRMLYGKV